MHKHIVKLRGKQLHLIKIDPLFSLVYWLKLSKIIYVKKVCNQTFFLLLLNLLSLMLLKRFSKQLGQDQNDLYKKQVFQYQQNMSIKSKIFQRIFLFQSNIPLQYKIPKKYQVGLKIIYNQQTKQVLSMKNHFISFLAKK
ncbi:hypothetical protein TTHERM_000220707 (macronuclear) [Tetrahymena thermophila SB210]|uniref:Uncharacterized protein n=1 Tax=Tetrahymena thermophila (strain SB210) TaxID=312017 RepID=W7XIH8_TETTS|nr:hypothetical protein TTHERM_000220707 [Tetrahymena thermophila SB210]EWS73289.1 hypothetical protein TTHERM_000220707 [Tetrahymena thermophila SB210]|eukprot:XP_012654198.1 hypothetical protein TTHERM_000220707 [Tetrahymena thermophila SB210]